MERIGLAFVLVLVAWPAAAQDVIEGTITRVIDGDTFVMRAGNKDVHIRLWAVDAPELSDHSGSRAKAILESIIGTYGAAMRCQTAGVSYNRIVARCFSSRGYDIGEAMIRTGAAVEYQRFGKGVYRDAERAAQKGR